MFLNCYSSFSFRYGVMPVETLLESLSNAGCSTVALTDINNTSACLDFIRRAPEYGIRPVVGIDFRSGVEERYIGLAKNNRGFFELNQHLSEIISSSGTPEYTAPEFDHVIVIYPFSAEKLRKLRKNEFIGIRPHETGKLMFSPWKNHPEKLVALTGFIFRNKNDYNTHRLLRAIDNNTLLSKLPLSEQAFPGMVSLSDPFYIQQAYQRFPFLPETAQQLLAQCSISFEFGKSKNKKTFTGDRNSDLELLRRKCFEGLYQRYKNPDDAIIERAEHELQVISEMDFSSYFLINGDIVNYARHKNYFYVGRGSGANSLVAYCLQITDVDPVDLDLYFERFINPSRKTPPDFDIDFSWKDREDVIDYIFTRHDRKHTALLATYNTFQRKSVVRELGKVFGLPANEIEVLAEESKQHLWESDHISSLVMKYTERIHDLPSHLSIHAGGILISEDQLCNYTATSCSSKNYPLTQFSMVEAEDIGLYKFDILSQRGLGHIKDALELIRKNKNITVDIRAVEQFKQDEKIKEHLRNGKTMGCFYVESPAMRMLLKKLKADTYLGLVAASSVIRPGVARSGMMREYILRFRYPERRKQVHPVMDELMKETFGIMVYQEDVIKVAHYFAGLTLTQSDVLRRGMSGKFRSREEFQQVREDFFSNCRNRNYAEEDIAEVWRQIESFASYSFSKGHSASYAVESYQSLFLKAYYPVEFIVGVINNFGGFYQTEDYVQEARRNGIPVHAPCINRSDYQTTIYKQEIYLGFIHMSSLQEKKARQMICEREQYGAFESLADFLSRVEISVEQLRILIRVGAFRFTGKSKQELLWEIHKILGAGKKSNPEKNLFPVDRKSFVLPELERSNYDDALDEIEILGFPLCSPFSLVKELPCSDCSALTLGQFIGKSITITGYFVNRKTTQTIRGDFMAFGTFLDEAGNFFDTTHFPPVFKAFPFRGRGCYLIREK